MSTIAENLREPLKAEDDYFRALEERVMRTVELLKSERERRLSAEAQVSRLEDELSGMRGERDAIRQRIERLLKQLDEA
jgi:chromosome segregation ATPase